MSAILTPMLPLGLRRARKGTDAVVAIDVRLCESGGEQLHLATRHSGSSVAVYREAPQRNQSGASQAQRMPTRRDRRWVSRTEVQSRARCFVLVSCSAVSSGVVMAITVRGVTHRGSCPTSRGCRDGYVPREYRYHSAS